MSLGLTTELVLERLAGVVRADERPGEGAIAELGKIPSHEFYATLEFAAKRGWVENVHATIPDGNFNYAITDRGQRAVAAHRRREERARL